MSKKQTFELSLIWCGYNKRIKVSTSKPEWFNDGVRNVTGDWVEYLIRPIELEIELPEDFDPLQPQLKALDAKEKAVTAKYQLDMTNIKAERQKLLALENNAS